jgi:RNA polymerase sigma-70 factor, ECF subfamily
MAARAGPARWIRHLCDTRAALLGAFGQSREIPCRVGILRLHNKKKEKRTLEALRGMEATESTPSPGQEAILRNMPGLRAQLARVTGSVELAADLLQDAVVTALQKLRAGQITDPGHLDGYVYRVALNHLRNYRRKDRLRTATVEETGDPIDSAEPSRPVRDFEADQWARMVKQLLQEVPLVRDRELLVRFYLQEESKEDLCRAFGLTELHFNRVIHRARDRFRELLQRRGLSKSDFLSIGAILLLAASL